MTYFELVPLLDRVEKYALVLSFGEKSFLEKVYLFYKKGIVLVPGRPFTRKLTDWLILEDILIRLSEIFDLRHLGFVVYKDIREIWQETREGNNSHTYFVVDDDGQEHQVTIHSNYYLVFTPSSGLYSMDLVDYPQSTDGEEILPERIQMQFRLTLTKEDMWKVVYRMAFFGYIFP